MAYIRVHDKLFDTFLTQEEIQTRISFIAEQLNADYADKKPLFIAILNGSFIFASDLFKKLHIDAEICFIKLASYKGSKSSGHVVTAIGLDNDIFDRHIVIIEDIVDTGITLSYLIEKVKAQGPASIAVCTLLLKPLSLQKEIDIDYVGFEIQNEFVVGYGLDYKGLGRNLTDIYRAISTPSET